MTKSQRYLIVGVVILLSWASVMIVSCKKGGDTTAEPQLEEAQAPAEREILYYTCGMHPSVRVSPEDYEKGNKSCPTCNMDLVPVYKEADTSMGMETGEHQGEEISVRLSSRAQALAQVKTEEIQFRHLFKEIDTTGEIAFDERNLAYVAAWISGRLDKLYVNFTGVDVKRGSRLASVYSPNLLTTQEEYLLALETLEKVKQSPDVDAVQETLALVEASKKRLLLWGISEDQIKELGTEKTASTHMILYAPIGGTVIHKNAIEGKYVKEGENLFQIADLSNLWVLADVYEYELSFIKKGQKVKIIAPAFPNEIFEGQIAFIDPYLNPKTRSIKVRVNVPNPKMRLKPGMFVNVMISAHVDEGLKASQKVMYTCSMHPEVVADNPGDCPKCGMELVKKSTVPTGMVLAVPKSAILDTGPRKLVYVEKEPGVYIQKEIEVGVEAMSLVDGQRRRFYNILAGLTESAKVVTHANFLIDSQSQITGQAEAIYSGALEKDEKKKIPPAKHIH